MTVVYDNMTEEELERKTRHNVKVAGLESRLRLLKHQRAVLDDRIKKSEAYLNQLRLTTL